jgi:hypothetical protein
MAMAFRKNPPAGVQLRGAREQLDGLGRLAGLGEQVAEPVDGVQVVRLVLDQRAELDDRGRELALPDQLLRLLEDLRPVDRHAG